MVDGEIRDGRHHMRVRVYYKDTDQHVSDTYIFCLSNLDKTTTRGYRCGVDMARNGNDWLS